MFFRLANHRRRARIAIATPVIGLVIALTSLTCAPSAPAATVATSAAHSCAIFSGQVRCWGSNGGGGLGFAASTTTPFATLVGAPITGATDINGTGTGSGSASHVCAVAGGKGWCWGTNGYGTSGDGTTTDTAIPTAIPAFTSGMSVIDKNATRTCAVVNGGAFCWGSAPLGDDTSNNAPSPVAVTDMASGVTDIAAGWRSTCALRSGAVYCWGQTTHGQLGGGTDAKKPSVPVALPGPATAVDGGTDSYCAVVNGGVHCWGSNGDGKLGVGDLGYDYSAPTTPPVVSGLPAGSGVVDVSGNSGHFCALLADGGVRCWGSNHNGKLGNGATTGNSPAPVAVNLPGKATSVAVSSSHTCAAVGADVYCWGNNGHGALGNGTVGGVSGTPVKVLLAPGQAAPKAKATILGATREVRPGRTRTVTIGSVRCPKRAGRCTVALPRTVQVTLQRVAYAVTITRRPTIAAGATANLTATLPRALYDELPGKTVRIPVRVTASNEGGRVVKVVVARVVR